MVKKKKERKKNRKRAGNKKDGPGLLVFQPSRVGCNPNSVLTTPTADSRSPTLEVRRSTPGLARFGDTPPPQQACSRCGLPVSFTTCAAY